MPEKHRSCLLVPAAGAGEGMGHLARCVRLARQLGPHTTFLTTRMDSPSRALLARELRRVTGKHRPASLDRLRPGATWDLIVVDARRTTREEIEVLLRHGPVVCLDEGGEAGAFAPFLIDTIPGLPGARPPNVSSPFYLDLPRHGRRKPSVPARRILVSFGGEDREDLSGRLLDVVTRSGVVPLDALTVVEGPLYARRTWPREVCVLRAPAELSRHIRAHDLVITHFGITCFEALACGVPVILLNPTRYHARLGAAAGFFSIGTGKANARRLSGLLARPAGLMKQVEEFASRQRGARGRQLARLLGTLQQRGSTSCPVCGMSGDRAVARSSERTYRRCARCGIVFMESFAKRPKVYGTRYFYSEYKEQYGRTYLEDFASIKEACKPRVKAIRELLPADAQGVVVDVGCAYGPFLAALSDARIPGFGLDVSPGAVAWVRRTLGVPAICAAFEHVDRRALPRTIAAVTLWYVIEHFTETDLVLRKAASLLPAGGVFAFSTPNGQGISARKDERSFLQNSPADHFTILSPRGLGRLLARYGLVLRRVRVTGHHPERFPGLLGAAAGRWRAARAVMLFASRVLRLGDTFEAYAVKGEQ